MSEYVHSSIKVKQPDGSFDIMLPTTDLNSVIVDLETGAKLSEKLTNNGDNYSGTAAKAESVSWSGVTDTPTTVDTYGITDAVKTSEVSTTAEANKLIKLDSEGKLPIEAIPPSVNFVSYTLDDIG